MMNIVATLLYTPAIMNNYRDSKLRKWLHDEPKRLQHMHV